MPPYGSSALIQALLNREQDLRQESPWLGASNNLMKTPVQTERGSTWGNLGASLGQGLIAGALRGYGNQQIDQQMQTDQYDLANGGSGMMGGRYSPYMVADALAKRDREDEVTNTWLKQGMRWNKDKSAIEPLPGYAEARSPNLTDPLGKAAVSKLLQGNNELSPDEADYLSGNMQALRQAKELRGQNLVEGRFNTKMDFTKDRLVLPGHIRVSNKTPTDAEYNNFAKINQAGERMNQLLDQFAQTGDPMAFAGTDSQTQEALKMVLANEYRIRFGLGARLDGRIEQRMLTSTTIPTILSNPIEALSQWARGVDPKQFSAELRDVFKRQQAISALDSLGQIPSNVPFGIYPKESLERAGLSQLLGAVPEYDRYTPADVFPEQAKQLTRPGLTPIVPEGKQPAPPAQTGGGTVPKRLPGESVQQYRARVGF